LVSTTKYPISKDDWTTIGTQFRSP
jgi:hypothetical protein